MLAWNSKLPEDIPIRKNDIFLTVLSSIDIVESFNLIDVDGDGKISVIELLSIMQSVGYDLSEEDAEDIFYAVDLDGK